MWLGRKGRLSDSGIEQMIARRSADAGLGRVYPHQFRHTSAHEFRDQGGSEGDSMYLFGWSSTAMPHRYGKSAAGARARRTHQRIRPGDKL
jgi:integrase